MVPGPGLPKEVLSTVQSANFIGLKFHYFKNKTNLFTIHFVEIEKEPICTCITKCNFVNFRDGVNFVDIYENEIYENNEIKSKPQLKFLIQQY